MDQEPTMPPQMQKNALIPIAIVIAGVLIAGAVLYVNRGALGGGTPDTTAETAAAKDINIRPIGKDDHIVGNPAAPIVIVEYSDLECPFCKDFHQTMRKIMDEYGTKGQIAWVFRNFPIASNHPKAQHEHEAAECAAELGGNDTYWKYINRIFEITPSNNGLDPAELSNVAAQVGIDKKSFDACLSSGRTKDLVDRDYNDAVNAGAKGTPYSVVIANNQKAVINGAYPYPAVKSIVDSILQKVSN